MSALPSPVSRPKCYFQAYDNGCTYSIVARDMEHARRILTTSGAELCDGPDPVEWSEMSHAAAAMRRIHDEDAPGLDQRLTDFEPGDWFSSEF